MTTVMAVLAGLLALTWVPGRVVVVLAVPRPAGRSRPTRWPWHATGRRTPDLAVVVTEVASRLRAGSPPDAAWAATVERLLGPEPGEGQVVAPDDDVPPDDVPPALARLVRDCSADAGAAVAVRTVVAASRLTQVLGAPLAEVLDRCAATVTEAETARDARRVALAGPRSTSRILSGLPPLGLLLGAGLGADPLAAATDGGWGSVSVALGLVLLVLGRRWTRALVVAAEGSPGVRWRPAADRSA